MNTTLWKVVHPVEVDGKKRKRQIAQTIYAPDAALIAFRHGPGTVVKWCGKVTVLRVVAAERTDPRFQARLEQIGFEMQQRSKDQELPIVEIEKGAR